MRKFGNSNKISFLNDIPKASIELKTDELAKKCKFNFAYFVGWIIAKDKIYLFENEKYVIVLAHLYNKCKTSCAMFWLKSILLYSIKHEFLKYLQIYK